MKRLIPESLLRVPFVSIVIVIVIAAVGFLFILFFVWLFPEDDISS